MIAEFSHFGYVGYIVRTRTASEAQDRWRDVVADAKKHGEVTVTNHDRPEVVVMSLDRYTELKRGAEENDPLKALRAEFDREMAVLAQPGSSARLRKALRAATPAQLARAANASARRRPKRR